jgi:A/G-specific adenine glycosylase
MVIKKLTATTFQHLLLKWFDQAGRKDLPWQIDKNPYKVWLSEIMLQQTQVKTVIPYYLKFLESFANIRALANANEDTVFHLWAGLGYYSRARNLHLASKIIVEKYQANVPDNYEQLLGLPGIGPSTAAAILALAYDQKATILDGNVKRVLARIHAIIEPINDKKVENELWQLAKAYTPTKHIANYTQAMMDLGATLCTRSKPQCTLCPMQAHCLAYLQNIQCTLPVKKTKAAIPTRESCFIILQSANHILLQKRPSQGIWGGLWSLPEISGKPSLSRIQAYCYQHFKLAIDHYQTLTTFRHSFSHFHLTIHPIQIVVGKKNLKAMEDDQQIWYNIDNCPTVGLPKPIQTILTNLTLDA